MWGFSFGRFCCCRLILDYQVPVGIGRDATELNPPRGGGCGSKHEIHHFRPVLVGHHCIGHLLYTARGWSALDRADQLVARSLILTLQLSSCRLSQARLPPDMARHN